MARSGLEGLVVARFQAQPFELIFLRKLWAHVGLPRLDEAIDVRGDMNTQLTITSPFSNCGCKDLSHPLSTCRSVHGFERGPDRQAEPIILLRRAMNYRILQLP